jgi:signal-transduction protein with cAMP-binding, CBS, and nucleotidyltransferase domain
MKLSKVLAEKKDSKIYKVTVNETFRNAAKLMSEKHIGALLVMGNIDKPESYAGIITERTFINNCWKHDNFLDMQIKELMDEDLVMAQENDDVNYAMSAMTRHSTRYVAVCNKDKFMGLVSMGDIINSMHEEKQVRIAYLSELCGTYGNKVY